MISILQLEDGDIICFQKALHHLDVPSYLIYLRNRYVSFCGVQFKQFVCLYLVHRKPPHISTVILSAPFLLSSHLLPVCGWLGWFYE